VNPQYKWFADAYYGACCLRGGRPMWEVDALESMLYYARLPGATPEVARIIRERFLTNLSRVSEAFQGSLQQADPYRAPMKDYTWGSNKGKAMQARLYQLVALHNADPRLFEDLARRRVGIRSLYPRREPAGSRLSDEYDPSWRQSFRSNDVSFLVCPRHALAKSDRAASWPSPGLPGWWTQSAIFNRSVLPRTCWIAGIPLLRCSVILALPAEFHAAVGAAAGQVVSSVQ